MSFGRMNDKAHFSTRSSLSLRLAKHDEIQARNTPAQNKTNDIINRDPCVLQQNEKIHALISLSYDFKNMIIPLEIANNGNP